MSKDSLIIYSVFDFKEVVGHYMVVRQVITKEGNEKPLPFDPHFQVMSDDLELIRNILSGLGLAHLMRHPEDPANLLEVWM